MCVPPPTGMPLKPIMLGFSSIGNVIPSYFPKTFSNLLELLISLSEIFVKRTVRLMVANNCGTVSNVSGIKPNCSPLYGRDMTLAPENSGYDLQNQLNCKKLASNL